jgi:serine/threonine protein kinase
MKLHGAFDGGSSSGRCHSCGEPYGGDAVSCGTCGKRIRRLTGLFGPGHIIDGKYEVLHLLGAGGMGEVYQVRHIILTAVRCVKVMKKEFVGDSSLRSRFLREAIAATQVVSPHVAAAFDAGTLPDGSYYMVSEYIDGITLRQWISRNGPFPPALAVDIGIQVLRGLSDCHRSGLLHRDISPDNIMVSTDAYGRMVAKIIDLGIAKALSALYGATGEGTQVGMFIGNPRYSSPEQLGSLGEGDEIDARADLYCFGGVLFEMVTGVPPFQARSSQSYALKHLTEQPPRPAEVNSTVPIPTQLENIILKALEKDRNRRHADADSFRKALEEVRRDLETAASTAAELPRNETLSVTMPRTFVIEAVSSGSEVDAAARSADQSSGPGVAPAGKAAEQELLDAKTIDVEHPFGSDEIQQDPAAGEAFEEANRADSTAAYRDFLSRFPRSLEADEARRRLDERIAFQAAEASDSEQGWEQYLAAWGEDRRGSTARSRLEQLRFQEREAWEKAEEIDSIESWTAFISAFPRSGHRQAVEAALKEIREYEMAERRGRAALRKFLDRYPEGRRSSAAREALSRIETREAFDRAGAENTPDSWRRFIAAHPSGELADEARKRRSTLYGSLRDEAVERGDEKAIDQLLRDFPEAEDREELEQVRSRLSDDAAEMRARAAIEKRDFARADAEIRSLRSTDRRKDLERVLDEAVELARWEQASRTGTVEAIEEYLKRHPEGRFAAEARSLQFSVRIRSAIAKAEKSADSDALQRIVENGSLDHSLREAAEEARDRVLAIKAEEEARRFAEEIRRAESRLDLPALEEIARHSGLDPQITAAASAALRRARALVERREEETALSAVRDAERRRDAIALGDVASGASQPVVKAAASKALERVRAEITRREDEKVRNQIADAEQKLDASALDSFASSGSTRSVREAAAEAALRVRAEIGRREEERSVEEVRHAARRRDRAALEALLSGSSPAARREAETALSRIASEEEASRERLEEIERAESSEDLAALERLAQEDHPEAVLAAEAASRIQERFEQTDWRIAMRTHSDSALSAFVEKHPNSGHAARARAILAERAAFAHASDEETIEGWRGFLSAWPNGEYASHATARLEVLLEEELPCRTLGDASARPFGGDSFGLAHLEDPADTGGGPLQLLLRHRTAGIAATLLVALIVILLAGYLLS